MSSRPLDGGREHQRSKMKNRIGENLKISGTPLDLEWPLVDLTSRYFITQECGLLSNETSTSQIVFVYSLRIEGT